MIVTASNTEEECFKTGMEWRSCVTLFDVGGKAVPRWRSSERERFLPELCLGSENDELTDGDWTQPATRVGSWDEFAQLGDVRWHLAVQPFKRQKAQFLCNGCCIGSQCSRSRRTGVARSNLRRPRTRRAAAFRIDCRRSSEQAGRSAKLLLIFTKNWIYCKF